MATLRNQVLDQAAVSFSNFIDALGAVPSSTSQKSSEDQKKELLETTKTGLKKFQQRIIEGVSALVKHGIFKQKKFTTETFSQVVHEVMEHIMPCESIQERLGFSNEEMIAAYEYGSALYQDQLYEQAGNIFLILTLLKSTVSSFWIGFGLTEEMSSNYHSAGISYLMALHNDPEKLDLAIQSACCFFTIKEYEIAKEILLAAIEKAGTEEKYRTIKEHAKRMVQKGGI
jgi:hypothetical protein